MQALLKRMGSLDTPLSDDLHKVAIFGRDNIFGWTVTYGILRYYLYL